MKTICSLETAKSSLSLASASHGEIHTWRHGWKECAAHKILPGSGRSAKLSSGPRDKYTNVAQHMSKTHGRANIFMTVPGKRDCLGTGIYSRHVVDEAVMAIEYANGHLGIWKSNTAMEISDRGKAGPFTFTGINRLTLQSVSPATLFAAFLCILQFSLPFLSALTYMIFWHQERTPKSKGDYLSGYNYHVEPLPHLIHSKSTPSEPDLLHPPHAFTS